MKELTMADIEEIHKKAQEHDDALEKDSTKQLIYEDTDTEKAHAIAAAIARVPDIELFVQNFGGKIFVSHDITDEKILMLKIAIAVANQAFYEGCDYAYSNV